MAARDRIGSIAEETFPWLLFLAALCLTLCQVLAALWLIALLINLIATGNVDTHHPSEKAAEELYRAAHAVWKFVRDAPDFRP
jgi:hypothetical protein